MESKDLKGFEEYALIRSDGTLFIKSRFIKSLKDGSVLRKAKGYEAKTFDNGTGYLQYKFSINGKTYRFYQHRLLAEHFIEKPLGEKEELEVNHINHVRSDNRLENLEWVTRRENQIKSAINRGSRVTKNACLDCSVEIHAYSKRCGVCENLRRKKKKTRLSHLGKSFLYEELKKKTFEEVARENSVSSNSIRKYCKKVGIPHLASHYKNLRQH